MKHNIIILLLLLTGGLLQAQTMRWLPYEPGMVTGFCAGDLPTHKDARTCFVLAYTPAVSGVLTSYTTGFFIDCGDLGPTIDRNLSCSMQSSVLLRNACASQGLYMLGASGHGGSAARNQVEAGVPEYLHMICFTLPEGQTLTIREDPVTDLTTSLDIGAGEYQTEFPEFESTILHRPFTDVAQHTPWLDFAGEGVGHLQSHLTWTIKDGDQIPARFILERSANGEPFQQIADVLAIAGESQVYARLDDDARVGTNDYRLELVYGSGARTLSPVRRVTFADKPFAWSVSPSPANTFAEVRIEGLAVSGELRLTGMNGEAIRTYVVGAGASTTRLDVGSLPAGVYVAVLQAGDLVREHSLSVIH